MATQLRALLTNNPHEQHAALQQLRDSGDPQHMFFQTLLECSKTNLTSPADIELLFHCAHGMRHVILSQWDALDQSFQCEARDYLLELGLGLYGRRCSVSPLPKAVAGACLSAAAVFWKRCWSAAPGNSVLPNTASFHGTTNAVIISSQQHLIQHLEATLLQPDDPSCNADIMTTAEATCLFLNTLIGEFNGSSTTGIQLGLSLEYHHQKHRAFERGGLQECLRLAMSALGDTVVRPILQQTANVATSALPDVLTRRATAIVSLAIEILSWEFGGGSAWNAALFASSAQVSASLILIKPPVEWRDYLIRPDFLGAVVNVYTHVRSCISNTVGGQKTVDLGHHLRQLLLQLSSVSGSIFADQSQTAAYAGFLLEGCLSVLSDAKSKEQLLEGEIVDMCAMFARLVGNFKVDILHTLPSFPIFLGAVGEIGHVILVQNAAECEHCGGDIEMMEGYEWREEAFNYILDAIVLMTDDRWLLNSDSEAIKVTALFASSLSPLYESYIACRIKMSRLEEMYLVTNAADLDEVREEICATDLEEQMITAGSLGRISVATSAMCLSNKLQACLPQLLALFNATDVSHSISPAAAALLEEVRLIILCAHYLLTDDNSGETPQIPDAIVQACSVDEAAFNSISGLISAFMSLAEQQASGITIRPEDPRLSPLIGQTLLSFFARWAPAYVAPSAENYDTAYHGKGALVAWSGADSGPGMINFCITLCLHYFCFWPQETLVQQGAASLIFALALRKDLRQSLVNSPSFDQLATLQIVSTSISHASSVVPPGTDTGGISTAHLQGFSRLPYVSRAKILSALLVASSEADSKSQPIFEKLLQTLESVFVSLVEGLNNKHHNPHDAISVEMANLCIELYGGVARASEMSNSNRVTTFTSRSLPHLAGLMRFYAEELSICESLLRLFRDYTEQFIVALEQDDCVALFAASADLLKSYSSSHCSKTRVIKSSIEEEQDYTDVLSAIQLLIHLSTKDFLDISFGDKNSAAVSDQVTNVVFFGLQQILPLMTEGLLQFPTLCTQFFYLVGSMVDSYVEKVCALNDELFQALLGAILFGMSHSDASVSKCSLRAIADLTKEHIKTRALDNHVRLHPDLFGKCNNKLLQEIIFQPLVWDRLENCSTALLPLVAVDMNGFATLVTQMCVQLETYEKKQRLQMAFQALIKPEVVTKVVTKGNVGRLNRLQFKNDFSIFVKNVHSFLMVK